MTDDRFSISIVVPVYNGAQSVATLCERLEPVLKQCSSAFEAILVNDGSADKSWMEILTLAKKYDWVRGVNLSRNYGQHNALLCGIREAQYDIIVTMDDDLQHPPEEIPVLLGKLKEGYDVVYGVPKQEQHGMLRDLASVITKIALRSAMGVGNARAVGAFRAFRARLRGAFEYYRSPFVSIDVLLTWATARFTEVHVEHDSREHGESNYTFGKLVRHAANMMTGFSVLPLQMASWVGFLFTIFGVCVLVFVLSRVLIGGRVVHGFAFLASIITIFSGAQLFALGIIGEYLARMHYRVMDRPPYLVGEKTSS